MLKTFIAKHNGKILNGFSVVSASDARQAKVMVKSLVRRSNIINKDEEIWIILEEIDTDTPTATMFDQGNY